MAAPFASGIVALLRVHDAGMGVQQVENLNSNKVFNADLNGVLNILKVGAKLRELTLNFKLFIYKLSNPLKLGLYNFIYHFKGNHRVPLGIGASRLAAAGLTR